MLVLSRVLDKDTAGMLGDRDEIQKKIVSMLPNPLHIPKGYLWEDGKLYKLIQKALFVRVYPEGMNEEDKIMLNLLTLTMEIPIEHAVKYLDKGSCLEMRTLIKARMEGSL